jgi:hypothetical protein
MEVYTKNRPGGRGRLIESGKVGKLASRVRLI